MQIDDIIFLGAGASASDNAPLQNALFREYFQLSFSDRTKNDSQLIEMDQRVTRFFERFFGISIEPGNLDDIIFPTFEEVFGLLELALNREEGFKHYSLTSLCINKRLQQIREDLIFLIAITLDKKLHSPGQNHRTLIETLKRQQKLSKTGFVSLNYDIIIDNTILELQPRYYLDYGVNFTNNRRRNVGESPDPHRMETQGVIPLYKLHGSLNWLYCPTCKKLTLTPFEKQVALLIFKPKSCDTCHGDMLPIIIPPTFFKVLSNFYLQKVWYEAEEALKKAKRIFFCGYSFPDADIHIKYILKRAEINSGATPEIFIINTPRPMSPNQRRPMSGYQRKLEKSRYRRFFKRDQNVHYTKKSFEDLCKHGFCDTWLSELRRF